MLLLESIRLLILLLLLLYLLLLLLLHGLVVALLHTTGLVLLLLLVPLQAALRVLRIIIDLIAVVILQVVCYSRLIEKIEKPCSAKKRVPRNEREQRARPSNPCERNI